MGGDDGGRSAAGTDAFGNSLLENSDETQDPQLRYRTQLAGSRELVRDICDVTFVVRVSLRSLSCLDGR